MSTTALAQVAEGAAQQGFDFMGLLTFLVIIVIMYFMIFRPQQKKMKEHKAMIDGLRRGDRVITSGGIIGVVERVSGNDEVEIEIASGVVVKVLRATISTVLAKTEPVASSTKEKKSSKK